MGVVGTSDVKGRVAGSEEEGRAFGVDVEPRGAHLSSEGPGGRAGGQPAGHTLRPSNTALEVRQLPSGLKGGDWIQPALFSCSPHRCPCARHCSRLREGPGRGLGVTG